MNQIFYAGIGQITQLANILAEHNAKNIFLVTGKKSFELSGA